MKKYILISVFFLSCGSRKTDKNIQIEKSKETTEQNSKVSKESETTQNAKISTQNNSATTNTQNESKAEKSTDRTVEKSEKNNSENSQTKYSDIEYFESGGIKRKTEFSQDLNKLHSENKTLQKDLENEKSENIAKSNQISSLTSANVNLNSITKTKSDSITTLKKQIESYSKDKSSKTERKSFPWWLLIAVGFFLRILVGAFWKWFKTTNLFTKLPIIKK